MIDYLSFEGKNIGTQKEWQLISWLCILRMAR